MRPIEVVIELIKYSLYSPSLIVVFLLTPPRYLRAIRYNPEVAILHRLVILVHRFVRPMIVITIKDYSIGLA